MIEWKCDFNIPDSTVQLSTAYVKVVDYQNINQTSKVNFVITDFTGDIIIKEFQQEFNRNFHNVEEIYQEVLKDYDNAVII